MIRMQPLSAPRFEADRGHVHDNHPHYVITSQIIPSLEDKEKKEKTGEKRKKRKKEKKKPAVSNRPHKEIVQGSISRTRTHFEKFVIVS